MHFVVSELGKILQEGLTGIGKENVILTRPDFTGEKRTLSLPLIGLYDSGFRFEEVGFGAAFGESREQRKDEFSGDGKRTIFRLQEKPIRPLITVETPKGFRIKETDDFTVDYVQGTLTFRSPLPKGKNNLIVIYSIAKSASEIEGLKLKITCCVDVWAKNSQMCDSMTIEAMKTILISRHNLISKGIYITPIRGSRIIDLSRVNESNNLTKTGEKPWEALGRRLLYLAETVIKVELKAARIEKIEITSQK
jgi:hypothetical protein